jgi:23S rRNA (cytidine1920-2'-O)/16S rRNA (cytidine1409-2'-O)-methyltransferase
VAGVAASPLPGPSGNVEFFLWLRRGPDVVDAATIRSVVEAGVPTSPAGDSAEATVSPPAPPPDV